MTEDGDDLMCGVLEGKKKELIVGNFRPEQGQLEPKSLRQPGNVTQQPSILSSYPLHLPFKAHFPP